MKDESSNTRTLRICIVFLLFVLLKFNFIEGVRRNPRGKGKIDKRGSGWEVSSSYMKVTDLFCEGSTGLLPYTRKVLSINGVETSKSATIVLA
jgi:hypothetical protein